MNAESRSLYRRFYRAALFAVHYSNRSRPHVLLRLENLFRSPILPTTPVIQRTERFLRRAGEDRGIENKILKNFCDVEFYRKDIRKLSGKDQKVVDTIGDVYAQYDETLRELCETYGIHLI